MLLIYDFVLGEDLGAGGRREDVKHEIDVFSDPDSWIQDNAQKRKKLSGVYILSCRWCILVREL